MKKSVLMMMAACLFAGAAHAQYNVGDVVSIDGHRSIVIEVDATGQHGIAMQLDRILTAEEIAANKAKNDEEYAKVKALPKAERKAHYAKLGEETRIEDSIRKQHMLNICDRLTPNGVENRRVFDEYCKENNVDVAKYFPEYAAVHKLGDKWYLAGDAELEKVVAFLCGGYGKDHKFPATDILDKHKKIHAEAGYEDAVLMGFNEHGQPFASLKSSTWHQTEEYDKPELNGIMPHIAMIYNLAPPKGTVHYYYEHKTGHTKFLVLMNIYHSYKQAVAVPLFNF